MFGRLEIDRLEREQSVLELLRNLRGLEPLRKLFWSELNYDHVNQPLSRRSWNQTAANALVQDPVLFAGGGQNNDFHVVYCRLPQERLLLGQERPVVNAVLKEHPYALFVFSNEPQDYWHFINVKYDDDERKRRLFRRITVGPGERLRTAAERVAMLDLQSIQPDMFGLQPLTIQSKHDEAFDVEAVTKQFFHEYRSVFRILEDDLFRQANDHTWAHHYSLRFLNRCMFIYFIQRKGWLGNDSDFLLNFWKSYQRSGQSQDLFVDNWLKALFFEAFNNGFHGGHNWFPPEIREALSLAPYLNGGLFTENVFDQEHRAVISDRRFEQVLTFLERYNFTIAEDSPLDKEVAVDPEMIGKVYESLVNIQEDVDARGEAGIFYTPRTEIDLMCRLSLVDHLANHLGQDRKQLLYQLIFALEPDEKADADKAVAAASLWPALNQRLHDITLLDPACGSGSFLVGMLNILDDLQGRANHQLGITETPYERKKRIIGQSLYGVDVMEWACHIAELRLWLALIIDAELTPEELHVRQEPLLPHFSFKIRCGDSLVQAVGGINLGHIAVSQEVPSTLKTRITILKDEKLKFYNNDTTRKFHSVDALKNEEKRLFSDILAARQHTIQEKIKSLRRKIEGPSELRIRLDGTIEQKAHQVDFDAPKNQKQIENLTAELTQIEASKKALSASKEVPFVWDIAFVEIFESEKEGFDIVIGNPPYVRQEAIADPRTSCAEVTAENKREYKAKLALSLYQAFPHFFGYKASTNIPARKIDAKSDLYVYFYLHGLSLLNGEGAFCFITSNSWLDVGYGADLQEFLLKHCHIKLVLDNQVRRSFANADVNSIIVLFSAPDDRREWALDKTARFVMFRVPFEHILSPVIFDEIEEAGERRVTEEYRVLPVRQGTLLEDGCELPQDQENGQDAGQLMKSTRYIGNKWGGKYLRGPDIFFTVLAGHGEYFCRFGSLSSHIQRNNLQHLKCVEHTERSLCPDGFPFLHSVKDVHTIRINPESLPKVIPRTGQRNAKWMVPDVISNRFIGARLCFFEGGDFLVNDSFFIATLKNNKEKKTTLALLNSTLSLMMLEQLGRRNMGEGVLCIYGPELANHLILSPKKLAPDQAKYLEQCYEQIADRPIRPIFDELELEDRRKLDESVFDILRLSRGERGAIYEALTNLVRNRLSKADSV
ncbi:MAG: DNA methyltransferase [Dehalococcoidia bacterium]